MLGHGWSDIPSSREGRLLIPEPWSSSMGLSTGNNSRGENRRLYWNMSVNNLSCFSPLHQEVTWNHIRISTVEQLDKMWETLLVYRWRFFSKNRITQNKSCGLTVLNWEGGAGCHCWRVICSSWSCFYKQREMHVIMMTVLTVSNTHEVCESVHYCPKYVDTRALCTSWASSSKTMCITVICC